MSYTEIGTSRMIGSEAKPVYTYAAPDLKSSNQNLLIVGMGPVGLATAYYAAKNNQQIMLIEKRREDEFTLREQFVILEPSVKRQLLRMIDKEEKLNDQDLDFIDTITRSCEVKIGQVQRYIFRRIENLNQTDDLVNFQFESTIEEVDLKRGKAEVKQKTKEGVNLTEIHFDNIVGADGARSNTLVAVNQKLEEKDRLERYVQRGMKHLSDTYHVSMYVRINTTQDQNILPSPLHDFGSNFLKAESKSNLCFLRFDEKSYEESNGRSLEIGFVGELPKSLFDKYSYIDNEISLRQKEIQLFNRKGTIYEKEISQNKSRIDELKTQQREIIKSYIKQSVAKYLKISEDTFHIEPVLSESSDPKSKDSVSKVNDLRMQTFQGGSKKAYKATKLINGHGLYLIGDAYYTPNYAVGHGINDGISAAIKLVDIPPQDADVREHQKHMQEYHDLVSNKASRARRTMVLLHQARKVPGVKDTIAKALEDGVYFREHDDKIMLKSELYPVSIESEGILRDPITNHVVDVCKEQIIAVPLLATKIMIINALYTDFIEKYPSIALHYKESIFKNLCFMIKTEVNNFKEQLQAMNLHSLDEQIDLLSELLDFHESIDHRLISLITPLMESIQGGLLFLYVKLKEPEENKQFEACVRMLNKYEVLNGKYIRHVDDGIAKFSVNRLILGNQGISHATSTSEELQSQRQNRLNKGKLKEQDNESQDGSHLENLCHPVGEDRGGAPGLSSLSSEWNLPTRPTRFLQGFFKSENSCGKSFPKRTVDKNNTPSDLDTSQDNTVKPSTL